MGLERCRCIASTIVGTQSVSLGQVGGLRSSLSRHARTSCPPFGLRPPSPICGSVRPVPPEAVAARLAFPQHAFALALSENAVRLIEVFIESLPTPVRIPICLSAPPMRPAALRSTTVRRGRIHASDGRNPPLRQTAPMIDGALRAALSGRETPLILAALDPLASIYRAINTYPVSGPRAQRRRHER